MTIPLCGDRLILQNDSTCVMQENNHWQGSCAAVLPTCLTHLGYKVRLFMIVTEVSLATFDNLYGLWWTHDGVRLSILKLMIKPVNRTIVHLLQGYNAQHPKTWDESLSYLQFIFNRVIHSSTSKTPFECAWVICHKAYLTWHSQSSNHRPPRRKVKWSNGEGMTLLGEH